MKRILFLFLLLVILSLCACSSFTSSLFGSDNIATLKGWSFQYNEGTNDYSLFFGLLNETDQYISAEVNADIRIEDDDGNVLYMATRSVAKNDFGYYSSQAAGERFLANVRIKATDIAEGYSSSGTVYLKVYKDDTATFDEVNCKVLYGLPTKPIKLQAEALPIELNIKGYDGKIKSKIRIDDVSYSLDNSILPWLTVTISGIKTYGSSNSSYDIISYKLYDNAGYMITSGNVFLSSLDAGDKFKDNSITIYDIKPGENYTLKFSEYR